MRQVKKKKNIKYFKNEFKILNDFIKFHKFQKMKLISLELLKIYSILILQYYNTNSRYFFSIFSLNILHNLKIFL